MNQEFIPEPCLLSLGYWLTPVELADISHCSLRMWGFVLAANGPSNSPAASDSIPGQGTEGDLTPEDVKTR